MRRLIAIGALALLVVAVVPFASAGTTVATKHVDGTVKVLEPARAGGPPYAREWLARFEVRTTPDGATVQFGYMHLYGITNDDPAGNNAGAIHEFSVQSVTYFKTPTGQGATLHMEECILIDQEAEPGSCFDSDYQVSDGSPDTFMPQLGWEIESGNISIYTTSGQNSQ